MRSAVRSLSTAVVIAVRAPAYEITRLVLLLIAIVDPRIQPSRMIANGAATVNSVPHDGWGEGGAGAPVAAGAPDPGAAAVGGCARARYLPGISVPLAKR